MWELILQKGGVIVWLLKIFLGCLFGAIIGKYLNVYTFKILQKEYDVAQCKTGALFIYSLPGILNVVTYLLIFILIENYAQCFLYSLMASVLIVISVVDVRTYQIPIVCNRLLLLLGILQLVLDYKNWFLYLAGMIFVSIFMLLVYLLTKGTGIGGGDIKLMAAAGLILGGNRIWIALFVGAMLGSVIQLTRIVAGQKGHVFAFGPYLSVGIFFAAMFGDKF